MTAPKRPAAPSGRAPAKKAAAKKAPARKRAAAKKPAGPTPAQIEADRKVLDLRRAGVAFDVIVELDRLDRLQAVLWTKALRGDTAAIEQVTRLALARERFTTPTPTPQPDAGPVETATVQEFANVAGVDQALVAAAVRLARDVDQADSATARVLSNRELRMTKQMILDLLAVTRQGPSLTDGNRAEGTVVPESRLAALRAKAADRG